MKCITVLKECLKYITIDLVLCYQFYVDVIVLYIVYTVQLSDFKYI